MNIALLEQELTDLLNKNPELFELQATLSIALSHIIDPEERMNHVFSEMVKSLATMNLILQLTNMELSCTSLKV